MPRPGEKERALTLLVAANILGDDHGSLWLFIAGQLVMFFCWMIGGGYYMGKIMTRFDTAITRLSKLEEKCDRIDQHGTLFSQYNIKGEVEKIGTIAQRVEKLEANSRKLDVIAVKVENISEHLMPTAK